LVFVSSGAEGGDEFEGCGGVTEEVFEMLGTFFLWKTGRVSDNLCQGFLVQWQELGQARNCPRDEV
jgi:hypothetical protein